MFAPRATAFAALLLFAASPSVSHGRVYLTWKFWAGEPLLDPVRFGKIIYQAEVNVNGGRGELRVVDASRDLDGTVELLRRSAGSDARLDSLLHFQGMALGLVSGRGRVLRAVALSIPPADRCVLFLLEQSESDARLSAKPPAGHLLTDVPAYAGSTPLSYLRNDDTHTAVETSSAGSASPEAVLDFYDSAMPLDGWTPAFPRSRSAAGNTAVFLKGRDICVIMAQPAGAPGESRITVLHKKAPRE